MINLLIYLKVEYYTNIVKSPKCTVYLADYNIYIYIIIWKTDARDLSRFFTVNARELKCERITFELFYSICNVENI